MQTAIETGVSDGRWIEVTRSRAWAATNGPWTPIKGSELVILGDLSTLNDGGEVEVVPAASVPQ